MLLYIVYVGLFGKRDVGIKKKILGQVESFSRNFKRVFYTVYSGQIMYLMSENNVIEQEIAITKKDCNRIILNWIDKYNISKKYIRYDYADKWFIQFLKKQKEKGVVSVLEFPTIPYDNELSNKRLISEDKYYREKMSGYINQCTTYSNYNEVFGIPCIPLLNGIDIDKNPMRTCREADGSIVLLAVASMEKWHGYERVIEGMAEYYKGNGERNILFKLVGEGPETDKYKNMVKNYGLGQHVEFCGKLEGKELDRQYDEADIAVGVLGAYKKNVTFQGAPIKTSEYCSRGIPFIYGYHDTGLEGNEYYALDVPNDEKGIDINEVIKFYGSINSFQTCAEEMHSSAVKRYTWDVILEPVVSFFDKQDCLCNL